MLLERWRRRRRHSRRRRSAPLQSACCSSGGSGGGTRGGGAQIRALCIKLVCFREFGAVVKMTTTPLDVLCTVAAVTLQEMTEREPPQLSIQLPRRISPCGPDSPDHVLVYDVEAKRYIEEPRDAQSQRQPQQHREESSPQQEHQQRQQQQRSPEVITIESPESSPEVVCVGYYRPHQSATVARKLF